MDLRAIIDEAACIGCTLCIDACPVDAIGGAPRRLHTVLAAWCTGCEECIDPCPVDCIAMRPAGRTWSPADAQTARARQDTRSRWPPRNEPRPQHPARSDDPAPASGPELIDPAFRERAVAEAFARARARRLAEASR